MSHTFFSIPLKTLEGFIQILHQTKRYMFGVQQTVMLFLFFFFFFVQARSTFILWLDLFTSSGTPAYCSPLSLLSSAKKEIYIYIKNQTDLAQIYVMDNSLTDCVSCETPQSACELSMTYICARSV